MRIYKYSEIPKYLRITVINKTGYPQVLLDLLRDIMSDLKLDPEEEI